MKNLGEEILGPLGYYPMLHAMNGQEVASVTWSHPDTGIAIVVHANGQAEVKSAYKMITLSTGKISWPHPRLDVFIRQIRELLDGVSEGQLDLEGEWGSGVRRGL